MSIRHCPVCGVAVKLDNLERHLNDVHPRQAPSLALSEDERRTVRHSMRAARRPLPAKWLAAVALALVLIAAGIAFALPRLPAPTHPGGMRLHWHPLLRVTIDGQATVVPANIGVDPSLWRDHSLDAYGMQPMPEMGVGGMAPLHTHDASGTIHLESLVVRDYTLGDLFRIWGQTFDAQQVLGHPAQSGHRVSLMIDGTAGSASYAHVLRDGMTIEIVCGPG